MSQTRFFDEGTVPEYTLAAWYAQIERAPHLEQPAHQGRLYAARDLVLEAVDSGAGSVCDLGAGDGGMLRLVRDVIPVPFPLWGYDLIDANVAAANCERGMMIIGKDFLSDEPVPTHYGECVVLTEVLEHLVDPHGLLRDLPAEVRFVVASSPNNETWESRYEFHAWGFDMDGYRTMFEEAGWTVVRHDVIPGFQLLLAQR